MHAPGNADRGHANTLGHVQVVDGIPDHDSITGRNAVVPEYFLQHARMGLERVSSAQRVSGKMEAQAGTGQRLVQPSATLTGSDGQLAADPDEIRQQRAHPLENRLRRRLLAEEESP